MTSQPECGKLLVVDDDRALLRAYQRVLGRRGWTLATAADGFAASKLMETTSFDVIVSDINMPECDGLSFLRTVREHDADVPVILVTGTPCVDSSIRAIEDGVFRYLLKPVPNEALLEVVSRAARYHELARLKRRALELVGSEQKRVAERAELARRFATATELLWMAFQPIVSWRERRVFGYEALLRTDESTLRSPIEFLSAAERLDAVHELGRAVRAKVADAARCLEAEADDVALFVNLHSHDLNDPTLREACSPLSAIAKRVVLEITERVALEGVANVASQIGALKAMGFRIAVDDLGAGYAGLSSVTQLEPEIVKLDMSLVRGIDTSSNKQRIVASMSALCASLGILCVAEGVETPAERDTLVSLGCDLLQGYLFARPDRGFPRARW